jgi:hypothetical protein
MKQRPHEKIVGHQSLARARRASGGAERLWGANETLQAALDTVRKGAPPMVNGNLLRIALLRDGRKTAASRTP